MLRISSPTGLVGSKGTARSRAIVRSPNRSVGPFGRTPRGDFWDASFPFPSGSEITSWVELLVPRTAVVSVRQGLLAGRGRPRSADGTALSPQGTTSPRRALRRGLTAEPPGPPCSVWVEIPSPLLALGLWASPSTGPSPERADTAVRTAAGVSPRIGGAAPAVKALEGCFHRRRRCCCYCRARGVGSIAGASAGLGGTSVDAIVDVTIDEQFG